MSLAHEVKEEIALMVGDATTSAKDISNEARLAEDLGLDSMDRVELAMVLEERYGIEIADEEAEREPADRGRCHPLRPVKTGDGLLMIF